MEKLGGGQLIQWKILQKKIFNGKTHLFIPSICIRDSLQENHEKTPKNPNTDKVVRRETRKQYLSFI